MNQWWRNTGRTIWTAVRAMLVFTALLGVVYPLVMTGIGQLAFPWQANGSRLHNDDGQVVGSALIGQSFLDAQGQPLPQYFQPRPSAAGDGYDAGASGGTNWGPEDPRLIQAIEQRRAQIAQFNDVDPSAVPADALTASGSGLDPDISPAYAAIQVQRVASARQMPVQAVQDLVTQYTRGADLGALSQACVNVVELNLALDQWQG